MRHTNFKTVQKRRQQECGLFLAFYLGHLNREDVNAIVDSEPFHLVLFTSRGKASDVERCYLQLIDQVGRPLGSWTRIV